MLTQHPSFDRKTVNLLYRVYAEAGLELDRDPEGTTWEGSDDDRITLANRVLSLGAKGERDVIKLRRGVVESFSYLGR